MSRKHNAPFRSPKETGARTDGATRKETVDELRQKLEKVSEEIKKLQTQGYKEEELKLHIDKMHEYNELKDIGQLVLGQLATLKGVCTRDLYSKYGLQLDD